MREDVRLFPAEQIELGTRGEKREAGLGEFHPAIAQEPRRQLVAQRMQVEHVGGGIFELRRRKNVGGPIGRLLLLGNVDVEKFLEIVLETVPVRIGGGRGARRSWCRRPATR